MNFKEFLTEMETTSEEKERIRTIIKHLIANDTEWFKQKNILVTNRSPYWILNYQKGPNINEYNRLVRGMVVQQPTTIPNDLLSLVKSFPFTRFFNRRETHADPVDFDNSEMIEKLDGTMVATYFPDGNEHNPQFHTRLMLSTHAEDNKKILTSFKGKKFKILPLIKTYIDQCKFSHEDVEFTYIFEFIHEASSVITQYEPSQYGMYLLAGRNVRTHKELTEIELDQVAARIHVQRPRRFDSVSNYATIEKMFDSMDRTNFEGFVFRDKNTGKRVKVKDAKYVKLHHHIENGTMRNMAMAMAKGEAEETMAYFPHTREMFDFINKAVSDYVEKASQTIEKFNGFNDNKSLYFATQGKFTGFTHSMIMKFYKLNGQELRNSVKTNLFKILLKNAKPDLFLKIIGLEDEKPKN